MSFIKTTYQVRIRCIQIIAYYRQTYKAKHYTNKSHAYKLTTKTSKIKMKALSKMNKYM
jgi:hypothetical protein